MTIPKQLLEAKICNESNCKEIKRLNNIINKAIEYIEEYIDDINNGGGYPQIYHQLEIILDILKGSDSNEFKQSN